VLQTRPEGVPRSHPGRLVDQLIERRPEPLRAAADAARSQVRALPAG
jgi:hypothetical protein